MDGVVIGLFVEPYYLPQKQSKSGANRGEESKWLRTSTKKFSRIRRKKQTIDILSISI